LGGRERGREKREREIYGRKEGLEEVKRMRDEKLD
jgi:hypothetical protein